MSWVSSVDTVKNAFRAYLSPHHPCHLLRLPHEVFVDEIFPYFLIDDLLALRKTCKAMYLVTHHPIIWKRYMRRLQVPLTQLRPTFKFSENSSNYEIEFLVTRACALDRSWRRNFPKVEKERVLTTQYKMIDLKFLSGGKFLVASARDKDDSRFYVLVYALDLMYGSRLLARLPTYFKVYDLQARYMDHENTPGIMISYTRRRFRHGLSPGQNVSKFSHRTPIDSINPLCYETFAMHMDLKNIEEVIRPSLKPWSKREEYKQVAFCLPKPFRQVMRLEFEGEVHSPSLFLCRECPFYGCAVGNAIIIVHIKNGQRAIMDLQEVPGYQGVPHRIRTWRFLPCQDSILVFRSISAFAGEPETHFIEFYKVPEETGHHNIYPEYSYQCHQKLPLNAEVVIADPVDPWKKMGEDHPNPHPREECPPTLWMFASTDEPKGCVYWYFRPELDPEWGGPQSKFVYKCTELDNQPRMHINHYGHSECALPGSERTLLCEFEKTLTDAHPIIHMRRFFWPEDRFARLYPTKEVCYPVLKEIPEEQSSRFAFRDVLSSGHYAGTINKEGGMTAIAWDETSGRVALTSADGDDIYIWDLAPVLEPHHRLAYRWWLDLIL